ncbi:DUF3306 domain-containing protein [Aestuariirhabdus litorea]|uniref:DUF3306 domain-containing protein n=1 Tax=Aestuariirhabdus litorea TaxID=2528527 RepID=A0A3P3VNG5_9GAMM|nr:DUF3306 domain-containing protein [Aestuariirhabdus litorea]RRJ83964.1 DUF3306 domain-containing protein [Aestuariirhabdus litorea]RWW97184.1 DUF3306 domain-containing protein [Endozoicomonadaceae bacterium GTF-13]
MSDDRDNEGFARRWSRRKLQAQETDLPPQAEDQLPATDEPTATAEAAEPPPPPKTDADMPELSSLQGDDSYADFLSEGVSEELRRKALKQLFHQAHFNITDKLDDYDDDFSVFEPLGDTISEHLKQWINRDPDNTHPRQAEKEEEADEATTEATEASDGPEALESDPPEALESGSEAAVEPPPVPAQSETTPKAVDNTSTRDPSHPPAPNGH